VRISRPVMLMPHLSRHCQTSGGSSGLLANTACLTQCPVSGGGGNQAVGRGTNRAPIVLNGMPSAKAEKPSLARIGRSYVIRLAACWGVRTWARRWEMLGKGIAMREQDSALDRTHHSKVTAGGGRGENKAGLCDGFLVALISAGASRCHVQRSIWRIVQGVLIESAQRGNREISM